MRKGIILAIIIGILIIYGGYSLSTGLSQEYNQVDSQTDSEFLGNQENGNSQLTTTAGSSAADQKIQKTAESVAQEPAAGNRISSLSGTGPISGKYSDSNIVKAAAAEVISETEIAGINNQDGNRLEGVVDEEIGEPTESVKSSQPTIKRISLLNQIKEYRVKSGDNLWNIARHFGIDIDTIIGTNDITNMNRIKPGDILKILPVKGLVYKINPGENLWIISRQFKIKMDDIIKANNIKNPDLVKPGRLLVLPGAKPELGYQERLQKKFILPVHARISSYYGGRWGRMHEGIDYAVNLGTPVKAAAAGRVIYSGWASGYGKTIILEHRKGLRTLYGHNSKLVVHSGQWVRQGQVISRSGNTGRSTGPHLHFEIQINGKPVNPLSYLR